MTVEVQPGPYRTPFRDFTLGDWVGVNTRHGGLPSTIEKQRVIAISVSVDSNGIPRYELSVSSVTQGRIAWLKMQVAALIARKAGIRAVISDDEPTGGNPGDLWTPETKISTQIQPPPTPK